MDRREFLRRAGMAVVVVMEAERPGMASGDEDKRQMRKPSACPSSFMLPQ